MRTKLVTENAFARWFTNPRLDSYLAQIHRSFRVSGIRQAVGRLPGAEPAPLGRTSLFCVRALNMRTQETMWHGKMNYHRYVTKLGNLAKAAQRGPKCAALLPLLCFVGWKDGFFFFFARLWPLSCPRRMLGLVEISRHSNFLKRSHTKLGYSSVCVMEQ